MGSFAAILQCGKIAPNSEYCFSDIIEGKGSEHCIKHFGKSRLCSVLGCFFNHKSLKTVWFKVEENTEIFGILHFAV
uniref:Maintenance of ploidy protein mob1 n=1 Tax=Rhizophora mucronata TaxID=61149 RepID=A0A2P2KHZ6_RHIMU